MPLNIQLNMPKSRLWLQNTFIPWANGLPCKHVVFIAGNHDFWFERNGGLEPDMYNMFHKLLTANWCIYIISLGNTSMKSSQEYSRSLKSSELPTVSNLVIGRS